MRGNSGRSSSTRSAARRRGRSAPRAATSDRPLRSSLLGSLSPSPILRPLATTGLALLTLLTAAWLPLAGCAPSVETPAEAGYRRDLRDAERLAAQLRQLPAVREAHVTLTRPVVDPLRQPAAPNASTPPGTSAPPGAAAILLSLDGALDGAAEAEALARDARALALAVAPELPPSAVAVVARAKEPPPVLSKVGPFEVARRSRAPLLAALLGLLAACAGLGLTLAVRERGRRAAGRIVG